MAGNRQFLVKYCWSPSAAVQPHSAEALTAISEPPSGLYRELLIRRGAFAQDHESWVLSAGSAIRKVIQIGLCRSVPLKSLLYEVDAMG
jgi:hypothetical protein